MKTQIKFFPIFILLALIVLPVWATDSFEKRIEALEPTIGSYPPNFENKEQEEKTKAAYDQLKKDLDEAVAKNPKDTKILFQRGSLQVMGHNMDASGAWDGATADLQNVIKAEPKNKEAMVALGSLWVNTSPRLAPRAEVWFRNAQCIQGKKPLEAAQRGLFFAYVYQGRTDAAVQQVALLQKNFPKNGYENLPTYGKDLKTITKIEMPTCLKETSKTITHKLDQGVSATVDYDRYGFPTKMTSQFPGKTKNIMYFGEFGKPLSADTYMESESITEKQYFNAGDALEKSVHFDPNMQEIYTVHYTSEGEVDHFENKRVGFDFKGVKGWRYDPSLDVFQSFSDMTLTNESGFLLLTFEDANGKSLKEFVKKAVEKGMSQGFAKSGEPYPSKITKLPALEFKMKRDDVIRIQRVALRDSKAMTIIMEVSCDKQKGCPKTYPEEQKFLEQVSKTIAFTK